MQKFLRQIISLYPWVKKFPMPIGFMLLVGGGFIYSWTLMLIGAVLIVGRVWELAYRAQLSHELISSLPRTGPAEPETPTTTGSGS